MFLLTEMSSLYRLLPARLRQNTPWSSPNKISQLVTTTPRTSHSTTSLTTSLSSILKTTKIPKIGRFTNMDLVTKDSEKGHDRQSNYKKHFDRNLKPSVKRVTRKVMPSPFVTWEVLSVEGGQITTSSEPSSSKLGAPSFTPKFSPSSTLEAPSFTPKFSPSSTLGAPSFTPKSSPSTTELAFKSKAPSSSQESASFTSEGASPTPLSSLSPATTQSVSTSSGSGMLTSTLSGSMPTSSGLTTDVASQPTRLMSGQEGLTPPSTRSSKKFANRGTSTEPTQKPNLPE